MDYREGETNTYFNCNDDAIYTMPVASLQPNAFGLYDVLGNLLELTADCVNGTYRGSPRNGSVWTKGDCKCSMARGGSWGSPRAMNKEAATVTARIPWPRDHRVYFVGMRVVRELK